MAQGLSKKIANEFRAKIRLGEWPVGGKVPTTQQLASTYGVSVNTIQSAFRELEASNLVERRPRLGGFVKSRSIGGGAPVQSKATTMAMVGPFTDADYASRPDRWITHILHGCERELAQAGYHVALFSYDTNDAAAFEKVMSHIERSEGNIAGVMCFLRPALVGLLDQLDKRDIPWVMVNRPRENAGQNFVAYDAFEGGRLVGTCFAKMNLKRIAVLSVPMEAGRASRDQFFGCIQGYIDSGGRFEDIDLIQCDNGTEPMGYERFARYLATSGSPPSAVLAAGDMLAIGAIRACREKGLRIPEDVAIVGSTGLQLSAYSQPPLTVLEVPMERMGQEAGRMLMEMAKEGVRRMMGRFVAGSLVIRDSFKVPEPILVESKQIVAGTP